MYLSTDRMLPVNDFWRANALTTTRSTWIASLKELAIQFASSSITLCHRVTAAVPESGAALASEAPLGTGICRRVCSKICPS